MKDLRKVMTALVTPFKNNQVDFESLKKVVDFQVEKGIEGFVINGTTGESPCLSDEEIEKIFLFIKENDKQGDLVLIIGTGSNSTQQSIQKTKKAAELGADFAMAVVPYYNKPTQEGLFKHFTAIAECSPLPLILYNVPGRTITALSLETIQKLSLNKKIVAIKEASGQIDFAKSLRKSCAKEFVLLSGDDGTYEDFLAAGGDGIISVATHLIPEAFVQAKKIPGVLKKYKDVIDGIYIEANPIPVKKALQIMGLINSAELRLPLTELGEEKSQKLKQQLAQVGIK